MGERDRNADPAVNARPLQERAAPPAAPPARRSVAFGQEAATLREIEEWVVTEIVTVKRCRRESAEIMVGKLSVQGIVAAANRRRTRLGLPIFQLSRLR